MEIRKLVGWNIRRLRVGRGLTIEALADLADVAPAYLGQLERGQVNVGIVLLDRLGRALAVELADLFAVPEPGEKPPRPLPAGRHAKRKMSVNVRQRLRLLRALSDLLARDMRQRGLSLRQAAADGRVPARTLSLLVAARQSETLMQTAGRGVRRATLLQLRDMNWIGPLTGRTIDRLLEAAEQQSEPILTKDPKADPPPLARTKA